MTLRKKTPLHDKWHKRIEGQIKNTMNAHPEWFIKWPSDEEKRRCINSLAKRIVGEIVADVQLAARNDVVLAGATSFAERNGLSCSERNGCDVCAYVAPNDTFKQQDHEHHV